MSQDALEPIGRGSHERGRKFRRPLVSAQARERNQQERRAKNAAGRCIRTCGRGRGRRSASARRSLAMRRRCRSIPPHCRPIDSIVAGSDIRAFLQSGVPAELTKAALRRAWTTDPAIRDFIGIAENQWDFTDPTSIPGFGPLRRRTTTSASSLRRRWEIAGRARGRLPPVRLRRPARRRQQRQRAPMTATTSSIWCATRNRDRSG